MVLWSVELSKQVKDAFKQKEVLSLSAPFSAFDSSLSADVIFSGDSALTGLLSNRFSDHRFQ